MIIKCPSCQTELEVTEEMIGRNVRCSVCNTKFNLSLNTSIEKFPVLFPEKAAGNKKSKYSFLDPNRQKEIEGIIHRRGSGKYFKLFRLAPRSIKFIVIYNIIFFLLAFFGAALAHEKPGGGAILYFLLVFPLLKRRDWSWRCMIGLYYFCIGVSLLFLISLFFSQSTFVIQYLSICLFTLILYLPAFIALWRTAARQWASAR